MHVYELKGTVLATACLDLGEILDDLEEILHGDDPAVTSSGRHAPAGVACVAVEYAGELSGTEIEHARSILLRLSAVAVRPAIFRERIDGGTIEQYLGGTRREARSAEAAAAIEESLAALTTGDLRDVVEVVLARWRGVVSGAGASLPTARCASGKGDPCSVG